jgi:hypothetical protein
VGCWRLAGFSFAKSFFPGLVVQQTESKEGLLWRVALCRYTVVALVSSSPPLQMLAFGISANMSALFPPLQCLLYKDVT